MRLQNKDLSVMNITTIISGYNPLWYSVEPETESFNEAVELSSVILKNTIRKRLSVLKSKEIVMKAYENRTLPEVLVLDTFCPWGEALKDIDKDLEILFVVYPRKDSYAMQTVRGEEGKDRKYLPRSWAGKNNEDLAEITGVKDAVFCHTGRFIAVAQSYEGIMELCQLAISEPRERNNVGIFMALKRLLLRRP